jgi:hypothetical protein
MANYSEYTGIETVDAEIDRLRKERNRAANEQLEAQRQIDELFIASMVPGIKKGDYIRYAKDDNIIEGKVSEIRRLFGGVTIVFDVSAYLADSDESNDILTITSCTSYSDSISVKKEDLHRITKITREEFIASVRSAFESIIASTREPENTNQLRLNL